MRVVTPAMVLAVDVEESVVEDGRIKLSGMASTLTCDVLLSPREALKIARLFLKPSIFWLCLASIVNSKEK